MSSAAPTTDNPNGYFELEVVKQLSAGNVRGWQCGRQRVKVISALLEYLPCAVFATRSSSWNVRSRRSWPPSAKCSSAGTRPRRSTDAEMAAQFRKHLSVIKPWLARQPNMEVIYVSYNALMSDPEPSCRRVVDSFPVSLSIWSVC